MENGYIFKQKITEGLGKTPIDSILSQTLVKNDELEVSIFQLAAGQELSEHTSVYPAVIHILSGEGKLSLGKDFVDVTPGSWIYLEPGLPHGLWIKTDMVMLLTLRK